MSQSNVVCEICGAGPANKAAQVCPHGIEGGCIYIGGAADMSGWRGAGPGPFETGQAGETGTGE